MVCPWLVSSISSVVNSLKHQWNNRKLGKYIEGLSRCEHYTRHQIVCRCYWLWCAKWGNRQLLKRKYVDKTVSTGSTRICQYANFICSQWLKYRQHTTSVSVGLGCIMCVEYAYPATATTRLPHMQHSRYIMATPRLLFGLALRHIIDRINTVPQLLVSHVKYNRGGQTYHNILFECA